MNPRQPGEQPAQELLAAVYYSTLAALRGGHGPPDVNLAVGHGKLDNRVDLCGRRVLIFPLYEHY